MFKVEEVKTEYQLNPIGLVNLNPRFSFKVIGEYGFIQKSFRILVATSLENITNNVIDLWDSSEIFSDNNINITYEGKKLTSLQTCYVKVIVKNFDNQIEESKVSSFEIGLLNRDDFKGKWVSIPVNFSGGTLIFRKVMEMPKGKKIKKARAFVAGIGYHELYINGKKISNSVLNPGVTDYSKSVLYCCYDITQEFSLENNVFGVMVGYGWYGSRKLLAQVYVELEDGTFWEDHTANCAGWWVSGGAIVDNSIYGGEVYDARIEDSIPEWSSLNFEPGWHNGWMYTILTDAPSGALKPQLLEPIEVISDYIPKSITKFNDAISVYDMGQNFSGWAKIKVKGERGAKVILKYAEGLKEDGRVNQLNLRSAKSRDIYILNGRDEEIYEPRFTYHGCNYIEVQIEGKAEVKELVGRFVRSAVKQIGEFSCSNEILNQLHKNAVITEGSNLHSIMTDCPQRDERFGWLNDISSRIYQTVCNYSMERFFPKFVEDISECQDAEGRIADTVPFYTGAQPADPVTVCYLLLALRCYQLYGDKKVLEDNYKNLKAWVDYLGTRQQGYIMDYYYYGDWVEPLGYMTDGFYVSTLYYYWHLREISKIAKIIGKEEDSRYYYNESEKSKEAINKKYLNTEKGYYSNNSQSANSMALSLNIVPENYRKTIAKKVIDDIIDRKYHSTTGNQGYRHMFYALTEEGYIDDLITMITNPEYPGWGYMIECGATSVWERWENEMQNEMHSYCHPMFGSYDGWFYNFFGGINFDEDAVAYNKIIIKPYIPKKINYVNCSIDTIKGKIVSNWIKNGNEVNYKIQIPANTTAKIILQGKFISSDKILKVNYENEHIIIELGCGEYEIVTNLGENL